MNYYKKISLFVFVIAAFLMFGTVQAELIGVLPGFPVLITDNSGAVAYDASTDQFSVSANAFILRFSPIEPPRIILPSSTGSKAITINFTVDENGALTGGSAGDDLKVEGAVDKDGDGTIDFDGVLLTGKVIQFGSLDSGGPTDSFDFRFEFTGGALASFYVSKDIGVRLFSENSSFAGNFTENFGGGAKAIMGTLDGLCALNIENIGCVQLPAPPEPGSDCKGDVTRIALTYTGEGCNLSSHTQDPAKVVCTGDPAGAEPVTIIATDKKGRKVWNTATNISIGDSILVDAANAGRDEITGETRFTFLNAAGDVLQKVHFHTSCSQPLNAGNQFGSLLITSLSSTLGGEATSGIIDDEDCITELPYGGADAEYTYTITNEAVTSLTNVVVSDAFGTVPGSPIASILPGETVSLARTAFLTQATANTVTVIGTVFDIWQCEAGATSEIIMGDPPPSVACDTMIQSVLLMYTGSDILNANVEILAKKFDGTPVIYTDIDLTTGMILSSPVENGWTIDGTVHTKHGNDGLGATMSIFINGVEEVIHTSCSTPFLNQAPAPVNNPLGAPSTNWFVVNFVDK